MKQHCLLQLYSSPLYLPEGPFHWNRLQTYPQWRPCSNKQQHCVNRFSWLLSNWLSVLPYPPPVVTSGTAPEWFYSDLSNSSRSVTICAIGSQPTHSHVKFLRAQPSDPNCFLSIHFLWVILFASTMPVSISMLMTLYHVCGKPDSPAQQKYTLQRLEVYIATIW